MKTKWKRRMIVAAAVVVVAIFHAPLLRELADFLIVDETAKTTDSIVIFSMGHDNNGCHAAAAALYRENPSRRVLLLTSSPDRLEEIDATLSPVSISRRQLEASGVPQEAVSVLYGSWWNDWINARALKTWLRDNPDRGVVLLVDQFHSAQIRYVLDAVLDPVDAARVRVRALPDREYNDANWWTRRCGYRAFGGSWLMLLQTWVVGDVGDEPKKNADGYQRDFLQALREKCP